MRWLVVATLLAAATAHAETPSASVDVQDLPALPPAEDEPTSSATVLAASAVDEDVVVGAAKREQSLGNVASAVTVISGDRIRRFGYRTVAEAISEVAGVYVQDTRLTMQVGIRGLQIPGGFNSRILVLVDGATINEAWGAFAGVGFDGIVSIDDIARIEVIRGPVSSLYGTNAFFGIINIVTRGAAEGARAWGRVGVHSINGEIVTAGFAAGGVDQQLRGSVLAMNRIGDTSIVNEINGMNELVSDGADTVIAAIVGSHGGTFGQLRAFRSRRESPFAPYDSDPAASPAFNLYNYQLMLEGGHTRELAKHLTGSVRGYGNLYRYADDIHNDRTFIDYGDAQTVGAEIRARYEALDEGRLGITAGTEAAYNRTESHSFFSDEEATTPTIPKNFNVEGVYTEIDSQLTPWLGFVGGARFDRHSVLENATRLTPRAALFLSKREKYGLKLLYAEGFRYASMFESFFDDQVDFRANAKIAPEIIRSGEAVAWAKYAGLSARLSAFLWDARDVIQQVPIHNDLTPGDELNALQFQNIGRFVSTGVEAEASYRNSQGWYGFGGITVNGVGADVVDETTMKEKLEFGVVFDAPKVIASGGVSTPKLFGHAHVSVDATLLTRRLTRDPDTSAPPWLGLNAAVYLPSERGFDVTVGVRNVIGKRDLIPAPDDYDRFPDDTTSILVPRVPGEGREIYAKVGYSY